MKLSSVSSTSKEILKGYAAAKPNYCFACQWLHQLEETYGCLLDVNDDDDDDDDGSNSQTLVSLP